jgi:MoaA/NifB/PqqE/SkfB family radical SAM enzyme
MKTLVLNITNRCNFACKTCLRGTSSKQDLAPEALERVADFLRPSGLRAVGITGGEPILHPQFGKILEILATRGLRFHVVTNGWLIAKYLPFLRKYRSIVNHVSVSLDGDSPEVHDANRRPGSFNRALSAIREVRSEGFRAVVSHIVNRNNFDGLESLMERLREEQVVVNLGRVIEFDGNKDWQLTDAQKALLRARAYALSMDKRNRVSLSTSLGLRRGLMFCPNFWRMSDVVLRFDGKICLCCDTLPDNEGAVLGDAGEPNLDMVWSRHAQKVSKIIASRTDSLVSRQAEPCNTCEFCNRVLTEAGGQ